MNGLAEAIDKAIDRKLDADSRARLTADGYPANKGNDYERHLYARHLRLQKKSREEAAQALRELGLDDIAPNKREAYIADVLDSVLVGYSDKPLPTCGIEED